MTLVFVESGTAPVLYYIAITIDNTIASATPAPFQQMITIDSNTNSSVYSTTLLNSNFQDGAGNILNSWLESGNSNTSTTSIYWISLPNGIPASSSITIYQAIYDTSVIAFNTTNTGEAPQLSTNYAQYDNGANMFNFYDNFAGTTLSSKWTNSGITYSVNNGISMTATGIERYIISKNLALNPASNILDFYGTNFQTTNYWTAVGMLDAGETTGTSGSGLGSIFFAGITGSTWASISGASGYQRNSGGASSTTNMQTISAPAIWTIEPISSTTTNFYINYSGLQSVSTDADVYPLYEGLISAGAYAVAYTFGQPVTITWYRTRAYPPNGTPPTNTFAGIALIVNINYATESETYSIPTKINNLTIQYNELEQYKLEAQADIIIHYSNASNELVGFVYGLPPFVYNSNSSYSILENNVIGDKNGNFINDLYLYIQPTASTYIPFANYSITSKYLPPNTNVTSVTTSNTIKVNFGFTYTSISSWDSTTSVVTTTITDSASNPIPNIMVSWTSDGTSTTTPTSAITNASGVATTTIGTAGSTITGSTTIFNLTIVSSILT